MATKQALQQALDNGGFDKTLSWLYSPALLSVQKQRYAQALDEFESIYGADRELELISAPGRTEIGGNHTDHQHGRVLAAGVNLDIVCVASPNSEGVIRVKSAGYEEDVIRLDDLARKEMEDNKAISLIRGIAFRFRELGHQVGGFDAYTTSNVLKGSGLSSSAAFEVALGTIINHLYNGGGVSAVEIAQIGQYAENVYYGKPSGLMDQAASSVGGFITIDFADPEKPVVQPVEFHFANCGHSLCIVDAKGDHADLTHEYAAVPEEMRQVARFFGKGFLREVDEEEFYAKIAQVRDALGDRPVLRAMHFFADNARVVKQVAALQAGDFESFKALVVESGRSSFACLQNVFPASQPKAQSLSLALAVSERLLAGRGAWRVHGGGFAGTIQAFVPNDLLDTYQSQMRALFGDDSCYVLNIRPTGGIKLTME